MCGYFFFSKCSATGLDMTSQKEKKEKNGFSYGSKEKKKGN